MVQEPVLLGFIGLLGGVVGSSIAAYVNWKRTNQRLQMENQRKIAEYVLKRKVNLLLDLHRETLELGQIISIFRGEVQVSEISDEVYERINSELIPRTQDYHWKVMEASIFMRPETFAVFGELSKGYQKGVLQIGYLIDEVDEEDILPGEFSREEVRDLSWTEVWDVRKDASYALRLELNRPIENIVQDDPLWSDDTFSAYKPEDITI